jgi:uncharacterized protein involved in exopolysaccharide biosynthesis
VTTPRQDLDPAESINLHELIESLWAKRVWIAISVGAFTVVFAAVAFLMTPVYRATAVIVSASAGHGGIGSSLSSALGSLGTVATLAGIGASAGDSGTEESLAVLQSRELTAGFIADNELLDKLTARSRDAYFGVLSGRSTKQLTAEKAFKYFSRIRSVIQDKKSGLITVEVDWINRFEAADWANRLIARANEEMRNRAISNANASVGYLEKELASTLAVETREAISRLIESQIKQRMLANVTKDYAFRVVDPAVAPDGDDPTRPKRLLLIVLGPLFGLFFGAVIVIGYGMFAEPRRR